MWTSVTSGLLVCLCFSAVTACARVDALRSSDTRAALVLDRPGLYPEAAVYVERLDSFLVGSLRHGGVHRIDRDGHVQTLVDDPRLHAVLGIAVDEARDRVWVTNSDLGVSVRRSDGGPKTLAAVGLYELSSGRSLAYVDLSTLSSGPHLLNGIALDAAGNAYVTDSFSPVIYALDAQAHARVLVRDTRFEGDGVNLNGLVVHPDGYLLVVQKSTGALFRVPLSQPEQLTTVALAAPLAAADGLFLAPSGQLVVVANRVAGAQVDAAVVLTSTDCWATARPGMRRSLGDVYPTTITARHGKLYVLHSKLDRLLKAQPSEQATLDARATLEAIGRLTSDGVRLTPSM